MGWLRTVAREIFGLFVDDGSFAIAILGWLVLTVGILPRVAPGVRWGGPAVFAGLAVILIWNTWRSARRLSRRGKH
jgi:membrane protein implicated in regulation of membrane protease activity